MNRRTQEILVVLVIGGLYFAWWLLAGGWRLVLAYFMGWLG